MKTQLVYTPMGGVCTKQMEITLTNDGRIDQVRITGGCQGNTQGIAALVKGADVHDVITRLAGIECKGKGTSCPDQLSKALRSMIETD